MKSFLKKLILLALAVFLLWNVYIYINPNVESEMVFSGTMTDESTHDGIIIRNETVITSGTTGTLQATVNENEMVRRNKVVASVYKGEIDDSSQQKLEKINERIAEILSTQQSDNNYAEGSHSVESRISTTVSDIIVNSDNKNVSGVVNLKSNLNLLMDEKLTRSGEAENVSEVLKTLKEEQAYYQSLLSGEKEDLYSPQSGIFSTNIDGFESVLNSNSVQTMTPSEFKNAEGMKFSKDDIASSGAVCKIIDNLEWTAAVYMDEERASKFSVGEEVELQLAGGEKMFSAVVTRISNAEKKKCVVMFTSYDSDSSVFTERKCKIRVVKYTYNGLKVPMSAVRVKDGVTGVYTVNGRIMKFKPSEVLYNDGEFAILKADTGNNGGLLLYDEIVIDAKEFADGITVLEK